MAIKALVIIRDPRSSTEALSLIQSTRTQTFLARKNNRNDKSQSLKMMGITTCILAKMLQRIIIGASRNLIVIWTPGSSILKIVKSKNQHQARRHSSQLILSELNQSQEILKLPKHIITGVPLRKILNWITTECQLNDKLL